MHQTALDHGVKMATLPPILITVQVVHHVRFALTAREVGPGDAGVLGHVGTMDCRPDGDGDGLLEGRVGDCGCVSSSALVHANENESERDRLGGHEVSQQM